MNGTGALFLPQLYKYLNVKRGENLIVLGGEGQGLADIKGKSLPGLLRNARNI